MGKLLGWFESFTITSRASVNILAHISWRICARIYGWWIPRRRIAGLEWLLPNALPKDCSLPTGKGWPASLLCLKNTMDFSFWSRKQYTWRNLENTEKRKKKVTSTIFSHSVPIAVYLGCFQDSAIESHGCSEHCCV